MKAANVVDIKFDDVNQRSAFKVLDANNKQSQLKLIRSFTINSTQPKKFVGNSIKTAKYNLFSFLPLAILYQFNNYFNRFFLITSIIGTINLISPLAPGSAIAPFLFLMSINLIREAVEDLKKSKYDKLYNNSITYIWNKDSLSMTARKWADVEVGNIIKINKNEIIPCDVLVIKSYGENGFCYLETTNLDGESALKPREAVISNLITEESDLERILGTLEVDLPNNNIYKLDGTLFLLGKELHMFNIDNVLLRGGRLKNVDYVYGIVLYTGKETKIMKNIKHGSFKLSSIDKQLNTIVIYIVLIVLSMCLICSVLGIIFRNKNIPDFKLNKLNADYVLYYNKNTLKNQRHNVLEIIRIIAAFYIIFSTLIPISLIVSNQVIKGLQILIIQRDPLLSEDSENVKMKALSFTLHEDLGMVKYIFTDKTGTLTKNEMELYACSIFTNCFDNSSSDDENFKRDNTYKDGKEINSSPPPYEKDFPELPLINIVHEESKLKKSYISKSFNKAKFNECLKKDTMINLEKCPFNSYKEAMLEYFINIALNHNVLTEIDSHTGEKYYQGSNPDEVTLVSSAAELGIEFLERKGNTITLKVLDRIERFEVVQKMEFTSSRMRSSIIVRDSNNNYKLYMKGADTKIFEKLDSFSIENLLKKSSSHLESFAKRGLRTLCYSFKNLDENELKKWEKQYKEIKYSAINNKSLENEVEKEISKIEGDMILLGVSALEDKLQDEVKNDLQDFMEAGINVWMITGDKLDTAETIGYSCRLFNNDTEVFKIKKSENAEETVKRMEEIMLSMALSEKELEDYKINKSFDVYKKNHEFPSREKDLPRIMPEIEIEMENIDNIDNIEKNVTPINPLRLNNLINFIDSKTDFNFSKNDRNYPTPILMKADKETSINNTDKHLPIEISKKIIKDFKAAKIENKVPKSFVNKLPLNSNKEQTSLLNNNKENLEFTTNNLGSETVKSHINNTKIKSKRFVYSNRNYSSLNKNKFLSDKFNSINNSLLNFDIKDEKSKNDAPQEINDDLIMKFIMDENLEYSSINDSNRFSLFDNFNNCDRIKLNHFEEIGEKNNFLENENELNLKVIESKDCKENDQNNINLNTVKKGISSPDKALNRNTKQPIIISNSNDKNILLDINYEIFEIQEIKKPSLNTNSIHDITDQKFLKKDSDELQDTPKTKISLPFLQNEKGNKLHLMMKHLEDEIEKIDDSKVNFHNIFKMKKEKNFHKQTHNKTNLINFGLIIEGEAIDHCLSPDVKNVFWTLIRRSRSIIACRCSPIQKANLVSFVKEASQSITLAIGDGGNDVNMIKTANIGVGIFGKEGYQAAYSSDFAISQFKFLKRLIFTHGRLSLNRNSYFIFFYFFKNIIFSMPQFWLCFFSGFSGLNIYDTWFYLGYNSFMTTLPIGARTLVEEDIDIDTQTLKDKDRSILQRFMPDIYREFRKSNPFNVLKFFSVFFSGFVFSSVIYFIPLYNFRYNIQDSSGRPFNFRDLSLCSFYTVIVVYFCIIFEDSSLITGFNLAIYIVQICVIISFVFIYNLRNVGELSGIMLDIMGNINFWLTLLLAAAICLVPFYIIRRANFFFSDNLIMNIKKNNYELDYKKKYLVRRLEDMSKNLRCVVKFKKILRGDKVKDDDYANRRVKQLVEQFESRRRINKNDLKSAYQRKRNISYSNFDANWIRILPNGMDEISQVQ